MSSKPTIHVVDDDEAMRDSLVWLLDDDRYDVRTYASGEDFLERFAPSPPACVILDIRMPGISGVEVHERMARQGVVTPVRRPDHALACFVVAPNKAGSTSNAPPVTSKPSSPSR
jgi:FixJ family two-component response regulator